MFTGMTVTPDSSPRTAVHRGNSSDDDTSGVDNCKSTDDIISLLDSLRIGPDGPGVKVERDYDLKTKGLTLAHPQVTMDIIPDFLYPHFHKSCVSFHQHATKTLAISSLEYLCALFIYVMYGSRETSQLVP